MVTHNKKLSDEEVEAVVRAVCRAVGNRGQRAGRQLLTKPQYPVTLAIAGTVFRRSLTLLAKGAITIGPSGRTSSGPSAEDLVSVIFAALGPKTRARVINYCRDRFAKAAKEGLQLDEIILGLADQRIAVRGLLESLATEKTRAGDVKFEGKIEKQRARRT